MFHWISLLEPDIKSEGIIDLNLELVETTIELVSIWKFLEMFKTTLWMESVATPPRWYNLNFISVVSLQRSNVSILTIFGINCVTGEVGTPFTIKVCDACPAPVIVWPHLSIPDGLNIVIWSPEENGHSALNLSWISALLLSPKVDKLGRIPFLNLLDRSKVRMPELFMGTTPRLLYAVPSGHCIIAEFEM